MKRKNISGNSPWEPIVDRRRRGAALLVQRACRRRGDPQRRQRGAAAHPGAVLIQCQPAFIIVTARSKLGVARSDTVVDAPALSGDTTPRSSYVTPAMLTVLLKPGAFRGGVRLPKRFTPAMFTPAPSPLIDAGVPEKADQDAGGSTRSDGFMQEKDPENGQ